MGRLSALILQAVCLTGWLTERHADGYESTFNIQRRERRGFSRTVVLPQEVLGPADADSTLLVVMEEKEQAFPKVGEAVDRLANSSPTNYLFLALKHKR